MHVRELFDLSGKAALITGGSRGLGLEIAAGLGEAGAHVHISARREQWLTPALDQLRAEGLPCSASVADVSRPEEVERLVEDALEAMGSIDVLVNGAGVSWGAPLEELSLERWRYVIETNLTGTFLVSQAAGRRMIAGGGGAILNVSSIAGQRGIDARIMDSTVYHATKGGIDALTRDLAVKWARYNIRVNAIAPGFFPTRLTQGVLAAAEDRARALSPFQRLGREGEIKGVAVFLASAAASWITGQVIAVDGGSTAW
jgi:NAD(P)-dependent dehydrogenase (short-subunit alcohol dehydrogenase family)